MRRSRRVFERGVLLALAAFWFAHPAQAQLPPANVRDLVEYRRIIEGMAITPDGLSVAYTVAEPDLARNVTEFVVYVGELPEVVNGQVATSAFTPRAILKTRPYTDFGGRGHARDDVDLQWAPDSRSLFVLHTPAGEDHPVVSRIDVRSGQHRILRSSLIIERFELEEKGARVLVTGFKRSEPSEPDVRGVVMSPGPSLMAFRDEVGQVYRNRSTVRREVHAIEDGKEAFVRFGDEGRAIIQPRLRGYTDRRGNLEVGVVASIREAPDLYMSVVDTGARRVLTRLNPVLSQRSLGKVELLEWSVGDRRYWGHLIYPVTYEKGRRYPCVILAKDWKREGFYFDSQSTHPFGNFPAQVLAGSDLVVLMLAEGDIPHGHFDTFDAKGAREGYGSARDELARRGLIDPARCGVMGWSHTGWQVSYLISHPEKEVPWAAAVVSDHYTGDYSWLVLLGGTPQLGTLTSAEADTLHTFDDLRAAYLQRSAAWNASSIRTPLLQEALGSTEHMAEMFMMMRVRGKPVEFVWMPKAPHSLKMPVQREASLQRTVDWFRFWLQDYERSSVPEDPERYARWRKLRELHEQNERWSAEGKDPNVEWWKLMRPEKFR